MMVTAFHEMFPAKQMMTQGGSIRATWQSLDESKLWGRGYSNVNTVNMSNQQIHMFVVGVVSNCHE
jgi:hypothetical protein